MNCREITKTGVWTVSSVKSGFDVVNLFDGKPDTVWQSDSHPPHWISVEFPRQTFVSKVAFYLSRDQDDSYTPIELAVFAGNSPEVKQEIKKHEWTDPRALNGWTEVDVNETSVFFRFVIKKNYRSGKDSRVRGVRIYGAPQSPCIDNSVAFISPEIFQYLSIR